MIYAIIKITTMLFLLLASILLVVWVFRPGSKPTYLKYSKIALNKDNDIVVNEGRGRE